MKYKTVSRVVSHLQIARSPRSLSISEIGRKIHLELV